jgi:hopene-associated glycosyltransferase HpnB
MPDWLLTLPAALIWLTVLLLPWQPWRIREYFTPDSDTGQRQMDSVTVLIPARNEAETIATTLTALREQGAGLKIIVIDDQSSDATATVARRIGLPGLRIISTPPLPSGWSGKLWALEQGRQQVDTEYTLLLDADIHLAPGVIGALLDKMEKADLQMVSLMARLRMTNGWEKLLMPAFIYFFKLLYPFALANRPESHIAAAAGGCILVRTRTLDAVGGFAALRDELIDDCALARRIKKAGGRTWLGLSHAAVSERRYDGLLPIWAMVARTAYTQLRYSPWLLALCLLLLLIAYVTPVAGLFASDMVTRGLAVAGLIGMLASYLPTLSYYGLHPLRSLTLPVAAVLFGLMTLDSARRHMAGHGAMWKNRVYGKLAD